MSEELSAQVEPVTDTTAVPVESPVEGAEVAKPEVAEQPVKVFSQDEVNQIVSERLAREERKFRREMQARQEAATQAPAVESAKPIPEQFTKTEDYVEALADWKAEQVFTKKIGEFQAKTREQYQRQQQEQVAATYLERVTVAKEKYSDFDQVAYNPSLPITDAMAETIQHSDVGAEVHYYLGKNPAEAKRIASLSPFLQAKEIGRLEAKIADNPPKSNISSAPAPISPVSAARGASVAVDLDDPAVLKRLGTTAWIEAKRRQAEQDWRKAHG